MQIRYPSINALMTESSAYTYLRSVMAANFPAYYRKFIRRGVLRYELSSIFEVCRPLMEGLAPDDKALLPEVRNTMAAYLQEQYL